jgi:adenosylcobinamide-phosphate synthase
METVHFTIIALVLGFVLDQFFGDPEKLPHPIVGFGNLISFSEKKWNKGKFRFAKGALVTLVLVSLVYWFAYLVCSFSMLYSNLIYVMLTMLVVFFCLSARSLRNEVRLVFEALQRSTDEGRKQLARIVGRDTGNLSSQQISTAALETLAENLSDGVVAPLFWFAVLGAPGMLAYKMINTLDSMIGYKNERYFYFGKFAAKLDDVANFIPARITSFIMLLIAGKLLKLNFVFNNGSNHSSPNAGYPEAALAAILHCRFGGPNYYFGTLANKPFIGSNNRELGFDDMKTALIVNRRTEIAMLLVVLIFLYSTK